MTWPPDPLPNDRDNSTPQNNNHPTDHNDIANTLAVDFVGQINDNIAAIGANTGGVAANTGGVAANLASINGLLANFVPGTRPIVRGDGGQFLKANGDPIGDGLMRTVKPGFLTATGLTALTGAYQTLPNTTHVIQTNSTDPANTFHMVIAAFDFEVVGGTGGDDYAEGAIAVGGSPAPGGGTAKFGVGTINHVGRATVATMALITPGAATSVSISLQARQNGGALLANAHGGATAYHVISFVA